MVGEEEEEEGGGDHPENIITCFFFKETCFITVLEGKDRKKIDKAG